MEDDKTGALLEFVNQVTGEKTARVEDELGHGFVRLKVNEADRRQAKHDIRSVEDCAIELLRNARDAGAKRLFVATSKNTAGRRNITVLDDGHGIPSDMQARIFEPRVTSKLDGVTEDRWGLHGRGMALYAVSVVADDAGVQSSEPALGTSVRAVIDTAKVPERKDQSSFPSLSESTKGETRLKGVRNLPWVVSRVYLDHPELQIFYGSPAEIVTTIISLGRKVSVGHLQPTPLWLRIAHATGVAELERLIVQILGEDLSVRTLQRIMSGESGGAVAIGSKVAHPGEKTTPEAGETDRLLVEHENLSKRFSDHDLQAFAQGIQETFRNLGSRYFVKSVGVPQISRRKRSLNIVIDIAEEDTDS